MIAFYTCPRPTPYIGATLDSYFRVFGESVRPHVFEEPGVKPYLNRTKITRHMDGVHRGCLHHWLYVVEWFMKNTNDPYIMLCEDDIEFRSYFKIPVLPTVGYVSAYCSQVNNPGIKGWHPPRIGGPGFCGALCLIMNRPTIQFLLDRKDMFLTYANGKWLDYSIGKVLEKEANLVHYPTLILHTGTISTEPKNNDPKNATKSTRMPAL